MKIEVWTDTDDFSAKMRFDFVLILLQLKFLFLLIFWPG